MERDFLETTIKFKTEAYSAFFCNTSPIGTTVMAFE